MPSYDVVYLEKKTLTMWVEEGVSRATLKLRAEDHISWGLFKGQEAKLLEIHPTPQPDEVQVWAPPEIGK